MNIYKMREIPPSKSPRNFEKVENWNRMSTYYFAELENNSLLLSTLVRKLH